MTQINRLSGIMQDEFAKKNLERLFESKPFKEFTENIKPGKQTKGLRIKFHYNANGEFIPQEENNKYNTARLIIYSNTEKKPYYEFVDGEPTDYAILTLNKTLELYAEHIKGK